MRPAGAGVSRSMRYRNFGDTRTACSAVAIPSSNESPCLRARATYPRYSCVSAGVAGRRKARATKFANIVRAQASVCLPAGWPQTKILRRLSGDGPVV